MPATLKIGPFRPFFYAGDRDEPHHVRIERDDEIAKFRLAPTKISLKTQS